MPNGLVGGTSITQFYSCLHFPVVRNRTANTWGFLEAKDCWPVILPLSLPHTHRNTPTQLHISCKSFKAAFSFSAWHSLHCSTFRSNLVKTLKLCTVTILKPRAIITHNTLKMPVWHKIEDDENRFIYIYILVTPSGQSDRNAEYKYSLYYAYLCLLQYLPLI